MDIPKTILLLEDEPATQHAIRTTLRTKLLNPVSILETADEVIEYLAGRGIFADRTIYPFPLLLIVDVKASDQSGLEVIPWCRDYYDAAVKALPVLVLTHLLDTAIFRDVYSLGADGFFSKPFDYHEFDEWVVGCKRLRLKVIPGGRYIDSVLDAGPTVRELGE